MIQQTPVSPVESIEAMDPIIPVVGLSVLLALGFASQLWMGVPWQAVVLRTVGMFCMPIALLLGLAALFGGGLTLIIAVFTAPNPDPLLELIPAVVVLGVAAAMVAGLGRGLMAAAGEYVEPTPNGATCEPSEGQQ